MLDIEKPVIFPADEIIAGITKKNTDIAGEKGFSVAAGNLTGKEEALTNRKFLAEFIGVPLIKLKFQHQVHGKRIRLINKDSEEENSDGMICNIEEIFLCIKIADCSAILIFDPVCKSVAALHSGWRGTRLNIVRSGIEAMYEHFHSKPADLLVYLSPSASGEKYEVGEDVASCFPEFTSLKESGKFLFNNKACIKKQLLDCGVKEKNIEVSPVCTISNLDYHSFRRDRDKSGRMAAFIGII